jgi:hypothetical protein
MTPSQHHHIIDEQHISFFLLSQPNLLNKFLNIPINTPPINPQHSLRPQGESRLVAKNKTSSMWVKPLLVLFYLGS